METRRRRVVTSKPSRRGCRTCRNRKIKCDEARPHCKKCTSTGRTCEGYELSPSPPKPNTARALLPASNDQPVATLAALRPRTTSPDIPMTDFERSAFDYFCSAGARDLWRVSPTKVWIPLAMQIATVEPSVFHAVTAFAVVQMSVAQTMHKTLEGPSARRNLDVAMQQFSKASSSLRKYIGRAIDGQVGAEPVLLCSILFLCFELLRGKFENAVAHLQFGRKIILDLESNRAPKQLDRPPSGLTALSTTVVQGFVETFSILSNSIISADQRVSLDQDKGWKVGDPTSAIPTAFTSLALARESLNSIISAGDEVRAELVRLAEERISPEDKRTLHPAVFYCMSHCLSRSLNPAHSNPALLDRFQTIIQAHHDWADALLSLEQSRDDDQQTILLVTILKLRHFVSTALLQTCICPHETVWESFTTTFTSTLDLIDQFLSAVSSAASPDTVGPARPPNMSEPEDRLSFSLEPAVLPALALIALKCRHSTDRRRAIALLRTARRREGLLSSEGMAPFIETIINMEEEQVRILRSAIVPQLPIDGLSNDETGYGNVDDGKSEALPPEQAESLDDAARFVDLAMYGESPQATRIVIGRFRHEAGGELEVQEFMGRGFPMIFEGLGRTVTGYTCWTPDV